MRFLALALLVLFMSSSFALANNATAAKKWTILVYIAGDNNLAEAGLDDINEMEHVGTTEDFNIVVQIDGSHEYSPEAANTRRYLVEKDDDPKVINSPIVGEETEADMGSQETLEDFVLWGFEEYPAERYAVILWNHGNGWYPDDGLHKFRGPGLDGPMDPLKAICSDEDSDSAISTSGVGDVIERIAGKLGRRIDFVGFDACLMGMAEAYYELRNSAWVACASSKTEPGDGWPYDKWLSILAQSPDLCPEELGTALVETYVESYDGGSQGSENVTQSCVRFTESAVANFEAALFLFSQELNRALSLDPQAVHDAIEATQDFQVRSFFGSYFTTHKDLFDFAVKIKEAFPEDEDIVTGAELMMEAIEGPEGFVVANGITEVTPYGSVENSHGVAIYLPNDGYEDTYGSLDFIETGWYDFLDELNSGKVIEGPQKRALANSQKDIFGNLYGIND